MEMERRIAEIIYQYSLVDFDKKLGAVHIPMSALTEHGLTYNQVTLGFSLLSKHGVNNFEQCRGRAERDSGKAQQHFQVIPQTDIDVWEQSGDKEHLEAIEPAWRVFINQKKIEAFLKKPKITTSTPVQPTDKVVLYFTSRGELFRDDKHRLSMKKDGVPFKVFKYFFENPNHDYDPELTTDDMAAALDMKAQLLRNEINKLKKAAVTSLGLKDSLSLFQNKRFSGYRLNPQIAIIERD